MQDGWVESQTTKVLITGIAGSGKTSAKHVLFEEEVPEVRKSTPLLERPIKATRVDKKSSKWIKVGTKKMLKLLATAIRYYATIRPKEVRSDSTREETMSASITQQELPPSTDSAEEIQTPSLASQPATPPTPEPISETEDELVRLIAQAAHRGSVEKLEFVQFIDTGGQPQFLEIMPKFLKGELFCMFVIKLSEKLDEYPLVEWYNEKGELVGEPYRAAHTNEAFLKQGVTTMLSQAENKRQHILILGTHKDKECSDKETTQDKNKRLREILLPYTDSVVCYSTDLEELIFPMNARSPREEDHQVAQQIRSLIARNSPEPVKIPIRWYCLELRIQELAESKGRGVLSKDECFSVARRLKFNEKSFLAALEFLDELSSISYFGQILKGVVFADSQVLVDIVNEIVHCLHKLTDVSSVNQEPFEGDWRKVRDHGIVTIERLKSFKQHRVPNLFTHKEVIELFKALLILADFDESAYFMPCLLRSLHTSQLAEHRVSDSSSVSPLLLHFPKGPRIGVFCSLVVFLLSTDNHSPGPWEVLKVKQVTPRCLYRNCVEFIVPGYPATITLVDSFASFEVHVNIRPEDCNDFCSELCPLVKKAVLDGIEKARKALHYSDWECQPAFFCPCGEGTLHHAGLAKKRWICSSDPLRCGRLEEKHLLWTSVCPSKF